jgi:hypothetical protein
MMRAPRWGARDVNIDKVFGRQRASWCAPPSSGGDRRRRDLWGIGLGTRAVSSSCSGFADQFWEADTVRLNPLVSERLPHVLPVGTGFEKQYRTGLAIRKIENVYWYYL